MKTLLLLLLISTPSYANDFRTWHDSTGKFQVVAKVSSTSGKNIVLLQQNGNKTVPIPVASLSKADQEFLHNQKMETKRSEHTLWEIRTVGVRQIAINSPTYKSGWDSSNRPYYYSESHHYKTSQTYYYRQQVVGELVGVSGSDVVLRKGKVRATFKYGNLSPADQKFVDEFRRLDTEQ